MPNHPGGRVNGFISRLSADGSQLLFSTYLGTTNASMEFIFSLAEDEQGNYWFAGSTNGTDLGALQVTANALQPEHGGGDSDMYVGKISPDGRRLLYLTWLGGSGGELIETEGINDGQGNLYIAGWTSSADYPTTVGAYQRQYGGGLCDGFVTKISPDGHLVASTLLGVDDALPET
jgi:Tol biopolymer transport system component